MVGSSIDLITAVKETVGFFRQKSRKKISIGVFFRRIEKRYKIKEGIINILKSSGGKRYVVIGKLDI